MGENKKSAKKKKKENKTKKSRKQEKKKVEIRDTEAKNIVKDSQEDKTASDSKPDKSLPPHHLSSKRQNDEAHLPTSPKKARIEEATASNLGVPDPGRKYTVSLALPGSILDNAQSPELRSYLAGQIARSLVIFNVDEVVIFNESTSSVTHSTDGQYTGTGRSGKSDPNVTLARILQYLETPQYLRKSFFPNHPDLKYAGLLNPLRSIHHMKIDDNCKYREAVVLDRPTKATQGSLVNAGMRKNVRIDKRITPGVRVTVRLDFEETQLDAKNYKGKAVAPATPREEDGLYWGYSVRLASCLSEVFSKSPFDGGYDLTIGTSERGEDIAGLELPPFRHALVCFGGVRGLEESLEADEALNIPSNDPSLLFHKYVNACSGQGSQTIRTEEAILIVMSALRPLINGNR
eukprot:UC4_evm2s1000